MRPSPHSAELEKRIWKHQVGIVSVLLVTACGAPGTPEGTTTEEHDGLEASDTQHSVEHGPGSENGHGHRAGHGREYRGGQHGHHRFDDAERWAARFEDPSRDEWQRPDTVVELLSLTPTSIVADIGAATGYFPVRIARATPEGRVWGIDIEPDMVRYLNARARREELDNLFSVLGTPDDPLLPEPVDVVLLVNTYHHIADRQAYFERLRGHLRPGGRIVVVDFRMGDLPVGPPDEMKLSPEAVEGELSQAGYALISAHADALPYQYVLVFGASE